jgi:hypothetical protein
MVLMICLKKQGNGGANKVGTCRVDRRWRSVARGLFGSEPEPLRSFHGRARNPGKVGGGIGGTPTGHAHAVMLYADLGDLDPGLFQQGFDIGGAVSLVRIALLSSHKIPADPNLFGWFQGQGRGVHERAPCKENGCNDQEEATHGEGSGGHQPRHCRE